MTSLHLAIPVVRARARNTRTAKAADLPPTRPGSTHHHAQTPAGARPEPSSAVDVFSTSSTSERALTSACRRRSHESACKPPTPLAQRRHQDLQQPPCADDRPHADHPRSLQGRADPTGLPEMIGTRSAKKPAVRCTAVARVGWVAAAPKEGGRGEADRLSSQMHATGPTGRRPRTRRSLQCSPSSRSCLS